MDSTFTKLGWNLNTAAEIIQIQYCFVVVCFCIFISCVLRRDRYLIARGSMFILVCVLLHDRTRISLW